MKVDKGYEGEDKGETREDKRNAIKGLVIMKPNISYDNKNEGKLQNDRDLRGVFQTWEFHSGFLESEVQPTV